MNNDQAVLEKKIEDLQYEIDMLIGTSELLENNNTDLGEVIFNALLESFLVHARNLYDFLRNKKYKDDDVLANHFKPESESITIKSINEDRFNKEIMHITTRRPTDFSNKKWDYPQIKVDLCTALNKLFTEYNLSADLSGAKKFAIIPLKPHQWLTSNGNASFPEGATIKLPPTSSLPNCTTVAVNNTASKSNVIKFP